MILVLVFCMLVVLYTLEYRGIGIFLIHYLVLVCLERQLPKPTFSAFVTLIPKSYINQTPSR